MISVKKLLGQCLFAFTLVFMNQSLGYSITYPLIYEPFLQAEQSTEQITSEKSHYKDSIEIIRQLKLAETYVHVNDKKAFQISQKALESAKTIQNIPLIGKAQNTLGNLHWFSGDYNRASKFYFDALKTYQKTDAHYEIGVCYRNIGWIYLGQKKFDETEKYFNLSVNIMKELNKNYEVMIAYDDLANLYLTSKSYTKGLEYCKKSLGMARNKGINDAIGSTLMTQGSIELEMKDYEAAKKSFTESVFRLQGIAHSSYNQCLSHIGLSKVYLATNNPEQAMLQIDKAIKLATASNYLKELADAYYLKATLLEKTGKQKEAVDYIKAYARTKDTLNKKNNSQYIQSMAASFEMKQNELRIQNLEQREKLNQTELSKERSFKLFLIIILFLTLVLGILAYRSFLNKKKDNLALSKAYEEIEAKNKDISDSISYALNIQQARLPHLENLKKAFEDCFVIYLPRDTVSGDFFWHNLNEDGKNIFAIADCTGHGIPGAFMSMMGIDGLNYAILEKRIDQPSKVLTLVNRFIKDSLNQDHNEARSKDGMDVALCTFDANFTSLTYAGANRPLWIHRNDSILEFKPHKISIGGNHLKQFDFTDETIELQKGDMIYLFSDGFADQFGGEKSKKFMSKQLKQLLTSIGTLSCANQETELMDQFNAWKGHLSQVDDVVLVGIRI